MRNLILPVLCILVFIGVPVSAQQTNAAKDMHALLDMDKEKKRQIVQENMELSDTEARQFWPLYNAYQEELALINGRLTKLILRYSDAHKSRNMTEDEASSILSEWLSIGAEEVAMQKSLVEKLANVLPGTKTARYIQIENKIRAAVRYGMAVNIPLVN